MIKLQLIGNLGQDANINTVNGKTVINFSVAHTEKFRDAQGNEKSKTIWVACAYWTERTGIAPYLKKGVSVYVEGKPSVDLFKNNQQITMPQLRLRIDGVQLLGGGNRTDQRPQGNQVSAQADNYEPVDDLPF